MLEKNLLNKELSIANIRLSILTLWQYVTSRKVEKRFIFPQMWEINLNVFYQVILPSDAVAKPPPPSAPATAASEGVSGPKSQFSKQYF